jgi:glycerol-3-phosphate dehydrogenase subunit C
MMVLEKKSWPKNNADVCIRCAACMAVCPVSRVTPLFPGPKQAGPGAERFRRSEDISVDEWIDLCIGCHLCDMVCSSGIAISDLNLIAKAKYLDEKGRPFRDWLLTHVYLLGPLGTFFSPMVNYLLRNSKIKEWADAFLKIDKRRKLPDYQTQTFRQWFRGHLFKNHRKIAYFYGCYTNTNEVDVGKATVQVLGANGFEVVLPPQKCCGIPMLGNGNFRGARRLGVWNVSSLLNTVRSGLDVVFSSTSCGYMIKHEYGRLLNIVGSEEIAGHTSDIFEFLSHLKESGNLNTHFRELPLKVAYFAPCHLRSLGIGLPALEILRLIPGAQIDNIEADCCGLGGTFGFKKEKYGVSQEIGRDLAEAIDRIKPEVVLTDCEACRMQIRHLTGLKVLHPIQILRDVL